VVRNLFTAKAQRFSKRNNYLRFFTNKSFAFLCAFAVKKSFKRSAEAIPSSRSAKTPNHHVLIFTLAGARQAQRAWFGLGSKKCGGVSPIEETP
jgi:hypothetical protein